MVNPVHATEQTRGVRIPLRTIIRRLRRNNGPPRDRNEKSSYDIKQDDKRYVPTSFRKHNNQDRSACVGRASKRRFDFLSRSKYIAISVRARVHTTLSVGSDDMKSSTRSARNRPCRSVRPQSAVGQTTLKTDE